MVALAFSVVFAGSFARAVVSGTAGSSSHVLTKVVSSSDQLGNLTGQIGKRRLGKVSFQGLGAGVSLADADTAVVNGVLKAVNARSILKRNLVGTLASGAALRVASQERILR